MSPGPDFFLPDLDSSVTLDLSVTLGASFFLGAILAEAGLFLTSDCDVEAFFEKVQDSAI